MLGDIWLTDKGLKGRRMEWESEGTNACDRPEERNMKQNAEALMREARR